MKVMIFAAGIGKRLGDITKEKPKALVEINGKSILRMAVEKVAGHGFDDIIVNIHHFASMVEKEIEMLRSEGYRITVSDESDMLLETGGGLYKARWFFDDKPFLLYNADIVTDLDLDRLYRFHTDNLALVTLAVRERKGNRFLLVDEEGILRGWRNKVTGEEILSSARSENLVEAGFSGIHIASPGLLEYLDEGIYSLTQEYLKLAADQRIITFRHDEGKWWDIGTPENLDDVRKNYR